MDQSNLSGLKTEKKVKNPQLKKKQTEAHHREKQSKTVIQIAVKILINGKRCTLKESAYIKIILFYVMFLIENMGKWIDNIEET